MRSCRAPACRRPWRAPGGCAAPRPGGPAPRPSRRSAQGRHGDERNFLLRQVGLEGHRAPRPGWDRAPARPGRPPPPLLPAQLLFATSPRRNVSSARAGSLGQSPAPLDDLDELLPLPGRRVEAIQGGQGLRVPGAGLQDVPVERDGLLGVADLVFVEAGQLELDLRLSSSCSPGSASCRRWPAARRAARWPRTAARGPGPPPRSASMEDGPVAIDGQLGVGQLRS